MNFEFSAQLIIIFPESRFYCELHQVYTLNIPFPFPEFQTTPERMIE